MEVQGFAFEPEYPAGLEPQHPPNPIQHEDPGQARDDERTGNVEWYQCSYCQAMPTAKESFSTFCCQELHKAKEKTEGF